MKTDPFLIGIPILLSTLMLSLLPYRLAMAHCDSMDGPVVKDAQRALIEKKVAEGKVRWFCTACMKSFVQDGDGEPQVCPEGHRTDDPELTGKVGASAEDASE